MRNLLFVAVLASIPLARAHISIWDPSMWGFNVTMQDFPYDNRPVAPLQQYTFDQWWFHDHLAHPPNPGDFFELPAGNGAVTQLACNKGATKWWASSEGTTDIRQGEYPCPGYPLSQFHGIDDLKGCALSIAYTSDVNSLKPEDLAIFSVVHQCVWQVDTVFQVPKDMPPCPDDGCICAWHWIHSVDSGSAQMYMNGFRCKVTGATSNNPIQKPQVAKRCTGDPSQCNQSAQQPLYWFQAEGNNMFNGQYDPPYYLDEWGFTDGAQNNIFNGGGNNSPPSSTPPSSSSSSPPAYTSVNNQPPPSSSTPSSNSPSSSNNTPQGNSTPQGNNTPQSNGPSQSNNPPPDNGRNDGDCSPSPSPSQPSSPPANDNSPPPSPSPSLSNGNNPQGDGGNGSEEFNPANPQPPPPSGTVRCRNRDNQKRQVVASRHFRHKRHFARGHR